MVNAMCIHACNVMFDEVCFKYVAVVYCHRKRWTQKCTNGAGVGGRGARCRGEHGLASPFWTILRLPIYRPRPMPWSLVVGPRPIIIYQNSRAPLGARQMQTALSQCLHVSLFSRNSMRSKTDILKSTIGWVEPSSIERCSTWKYNNFVPFIHLERNKKKTFGAKGRRIINFISYC